MGKRSEHAPGTFSWIELATSDQDAAKEFYAGVYGWTYDDRPLGDGSDSVYSLAMVDGSRAAAISPQQQGDPSPPHWNNYITVASADETAGKATGAGGTALAEPFDVMELGRMAVLQDPAGAVYCIWEPKENNGAEIVNEIGAFTWNELGTPDVEGAKSHYAEVFGWTYESMDMGERPLLRDHQERRALERRHPPTGRGGAGDGAGVLDALYRRGSLDDAIGKIKELGGDTIMDPIEMDENSKFVAARDPQGAFFSVWEGRMDD